MHVIQVFDFNNYYNRIVKKSDVLSDYGTPLYTLSNANFNPRDGVFAECDLGTFSNPYRGLGDYLLIVEQPDTIVSRWFIIEVKRTRGGQYKATLRRDVIADFESAIMNDSPVFIEKGMINDPDSPLLFNEEQMTFNQIKKDETLLMDDTKCPWIVGYYAADATDINGTVPVNDKTALGIKTTWEGTIETWPYYKYTTNEVVNEKPYATYWRIFGQGMYGGTNGYYTFLHPGYSYTGAAGIRANQSSLNFKGEQTIVSMLQTSLQKKSEEMFNVLPNYLPFVDDDEFAYIQSLNGTKIVDSDGRVFTIQVIASTASVRKEQIKSGSLFELFKQVTNNLLTATGSKFDIGQPNEHSFEVEIYCKTYKLALNEIEELSTTYDITGGSKLITTDAPWNIFAMPYGEVNVRDSLTDELIVKTNKEINLTTAMAIQKQQQSKVYDIQLLPYCPIQNLISTDGNGDIIVSNSKQYSLITSPREEGSSDRVTNGVIFNVPLSRFDFNLTKYPISRGQTSIERKINNQCDKWRLSSPNYANYFDFSVEKNNGVTYWNVDCEYKPFTPYIHINPDFGNLYGRDYNDPRGLVCGGDFSLSQIIDQWEQYQIQNKNFQNIFDRQIQNMEIQQSIGRTSDIVQSVVGTIQGGLMGTAAGTIGGGAGMIAGGIAGTVTSAAGAIADIALNDMLRGEALDFTKDNFGYQLGNIQALPQTISKISSLNNNNKIFPVLEYYTCTPTEKKALQDKITYNGMTVMVIGHIKDYIINGTNGELSYVKGKLIRLEDIDGEDFHIVNAISGELDKGIYIKGEN